MLTLITFLSSALMPKQISCRAAVLGERITNESFCLKNQGASGWHIYSMVHVSLSIAIYSH